MIELLESAGEKLADGTYQTAEEAASDFVAAYNLILFKTKNSLTKNALQTAWFCRLQGVFVLRNDTVCLCEAVGGSTLY